MDVIEWTSKRCCSWDDLKVFERAKQNGKLAIRIYAAVPLYTWKQLADFIAHNQANSTHVPSLAVYVISYVKKSSLRQYFDLQRHRNGVLMDVGMNGSVLGI
jgi:hypothetical protein